LLALGSDAALIEGGLGVTRLATITGHEKSQVSRALAVLAEHGLVERSPGERMYRLGWECFTLAAHAGEPRLIEEAETALAQLVDEADESAHLSTLRGAMVLTLLTQEAPHAIAARSWVGHMIPAHCTSAGRALLFEYDRGALLELFGPEPFPPQGPHAPADVGELERRIRRARQAGYAVADEESEPGLVAVAAPIRDFTGRVVAAINISAPKFRLGSRLHPAGELVRAAAQRLSESLGAPTTAPAPSPSVTGTSRGREPESA
jgi:DNA-binding IclR family transcriptional regulator